MGTEPKNSEGLPQSEILIPKETASALGRGVRQLLAKPMDECDRCLDGLKNYSGLNQDNTQYVTVMQEALMKLTSMIGNIEHAKEVRIVPFSGGWDFKFSEERETETQPVESEITIDETTTPKLGILKGALQHNLNNAIAPLLGYSSLIHGTTNDLDESTKAGSVQLSTNWMQKAITPILNTHSQIKISTDTQGITTIIPDAPTTPSHT